MTFIIFFGIIFIESKERDKERLKKIKNILRKVLTNQILSDILYIESKRRERENKIKK